MFNLLLHEEGYVELEGEYEKKEAGGALKEQGEMRMKMIKS